VKINEQKLADACTNHGWTVDMHGHHADVFNGGASVKTTTSMRKILIDTASGPFGAVNDTLRVIESCIEDG